MFRRGRPSTLPCRARGGCCPHTCWVLQPAAGRWVAGSPHRHSSGAGASRRLPASVAQGHRSPVRWVSAQHTATQGWRVTALQSSPGGATWPVGCWCGSPCSTHKLDTMDLAWCVVWSARVGPGWAGALFLLTVVLQPAACLIPGGKEERGAGCGHVTGCAVWAMGTAGAVCWCRGPAFRCPPNAQQQPINPSRHVCNNNNSSHVSGKSLLLSLGWCSNGCRPTPVGGREECGAVVAVFARHALTPCWSLLMTRLTLTVGPCHAMMWRLCHAGTPCLNRAVPAG